MGSDWLILKPVVSKDSHKPHSKMITLLKWKPKQRAAVL